MPQPTSGTIVAQFIAGVGETFDTNRLSAWADQSGNGYDCAQASAANRPLSEVHGSARVAHDIAVGREALALWATSGYMDLNASHPGDARNMAIFCVARISNTALHQVTIDNYVGAMFGFTGSRNMLWTSAGKLQYFDTSGNDPIAEVPTASTTCAPIPYGFWSDGSATKFAFGDRIVPGTGGVPAAHTWTGGRVGVGYTAGTPSNNYTAYEWVFLKDIDAAGFEEWAQWLQGKWSTAETYVEKSSTLLLVGDSTLAGESWYTTNSTIAEKLSDYFPATHVLSLAVNSQLVSTTGGNHVNKQIEGGQYLLNSTLATGEAGHPFTARVCVIMGGTNDINSAVSAATLKAAFTSRVAEAKSYGATRVGICTIMDSTFHDSTEDSVRAAINADIKDLGSGIGHDFVINLHETANGGDDRLNDATANVGGVFLDGLHPSTTGRDVIVGIMTDVLANELNASSIEAGAATPGSAFLVGEEYEITWSSVGGSGNVKISLSVNNGSTFPIVLEASVTDTEAYTWTPEASHVGTQTKIRIEDASDDTVFDVTAAMVVATTTPGTGGGGTNSALFFRLAEEIGVQRP